jgi:hypothetical protein
MNGFGFTGVAWQTGQAIEVRVKKKESRPWLFEIEKKQSK